MLRKNVVCLLGKFWRQDAPNLVRANMRRKVLERKRIEASKYVQPMEPTPHEACALYRHLLKKAATTLVVTDKKYFASVIRYEIEITARQTSARVRGIMYEKGKWLLENKLGGVVEKIILQEKWYLVERKQQYLH